MIRELYQLRKLIDSAGRLKAEEKIASLKSAWNDLHDTEVKVASDHTFMGFYEVRELHDMIREIAGKLEAIRKAQERKAS